MMSKNMKAFDKFIAKVAMPVIIVAAAIVVFLFILTTRDQNTENNGYIRVINCIISTPATQRSQDDIESCYKTIEDELSIKLKRYDTSGYSK